MKCPYCNSENYDDARFCRGCGQSLAQVNMNSAKEGYSGGANPRPGESIEYSDQTGYSSVEQYGRAFNDSFGRQNFNNAYSEDLYGQGTPENGSYNAGMYDRSASASGKDPKKKKRLLIIIISAAVLAAAIIAVILILVFNHSEKSDSEEAEEETTIVQESEMTASDETQTEEETEEESEEETGEEAQSGTQLSDIEMYSEILDVFYEGISNGWQNYESYEPISYMWYTYDIAPELSDAGYAFVDIDGNGTDELIVTLASDEDTSVIYDLYTYSDGEIRHLLAAYERGEYRLCTNSDGEYFVCEEGSSGASSGATVYYSLNPLTSDLDQIESVSYEYDEDSTLLCTWYHEDSDGNEEEISSDEAQEIMDSYEECTFELTPFSIYSSDLSV